MPNAPLVIQLIDHGVLSITHANGPNAVLMGYLQGGVTVSAPAGLRHRASDASLDKQILQQTSALQGEALMQQQQQLSAYLAALQAATAAAIWFNSKPPPLIAPITLQVGFIISLVVSGFLI